MFNKLLSDRYDKTNNKPLKSKLYDGFFTPYNSAADVSCELFGPLTSPIFGAVVSVCMVGVFAAYTVRALTDIVIWNGKAGETFNELRQGALPTIQAILLTILSPLVAVISFLTRLAMTVYDAVAPTHAKAEQARASATTCAPV